MHFEQRIRSNGGAMRTSTIIAAGLSKHRIEGLVAVGRLIRPQRGWIALPGLSAETALALRCGAVVSCVSAAEQYGLWILEAPRIHLAARSRSSALAGSQGRLHFGRPVVPRDPASVRDSIENVLGYVDACRPYAEAHAIWESALNKKLVRLDQLRRLPYKGAAARLLYDCSPYSDSGLESMVKQSLRWIKVPIRAQTMAHGRCVDFLIGERLVLQIDGGHHVGAQRTSDIAHDAELTLAGYHVIRVSYEQVVHGWPEVQDRILMAVAQGLHLS